MSSGNLLQTVAAVRAEEPLEIKTYPQSKYCEAIVQKVESFLKVSPLRTHAARFAEIDYDTFRAWEEKYPDFRSRVKKAEDIGWQSTHDDCIKVIKLEKSWFAKAWILERKFPDIWALKSKLEMSGYLEQNEDDKDKMKRIYELKKFLGSMESKTTAEAKLEPEVKKESKELVAV